MTSTLALGLYYELVKPRMVYANVLVAAAAFVYGSHGDSSWPLAAITLVGLGSVIASGCALNNYADRDIDAKMERTKDRALVTGSIPNSHALVAGTLLLAVGITLLAQVPPAALVAALAGWVSYVLVYTPLKHRSPSALFVGAVAGATPPVAGYAAVTGTLDATALALFAFLFIWQLPHFVAISIYRGEEYAAAGVPMYLRGPHTARQKKWAYAVFRVSLIVLLAWCVLLVVLA